MDRVAMGKAKTSDNNMVVHHDFEKLLETKTEVIMSEGLQELLSPKELRQEAHHGCVIEISSGKDSEEVSRFECTFNSLSKIGDNNYRLELGFQHAQEFLARFQGNNDLDICVTGDLDFEFNKCHIESWDLFKDLTGFMVGLEIDGHVKF